MLAALRELSQSSSLQVPEVEDAKSTGIELTRPDAVRQRVLAESTGTSTASLLDSSRGESTEDEMDEDAVVLKHPLAA